MASLPSVEQQADKSLRGRPIGVVPFTNTNRTCVIACSREAKALGVKNVMTVDEAINRCPDIILVPQKPDLYRRAHDALLSEIETNLPVDELTCKLGSRGTADQQELASAIKRRLIQV